MNSVRSLLPVRAPKRGPRRWPRGITLIELLVSIGIVTILIGLLLPRVAATRAQAKQVSDTSRGREMGLMTVDYCASHRDLPPVLFPPVYVNPAVGVPWQEAAVDGMVLKGAWWTNSLHYHLRFDVPPPFDVARVNGAPRDNFVTVAGSATARTTDFGLAHTLYADPSYWNVDTQVGEGQWRPQALTSTAFPSQKGLVHQLLVFGRAGSERGVPSCCGEDVSSVVVWTDLSATQEVQGRLRPGVPNFWHHGLAGPLPVQAKGVAVDNTETGIQGRDR